MTIDDLDNTLDPLIQDIHWAEKVLDKEDNQFTRRAYIRSLFSTIEGSVWVLKKTLLHIAVHEGHIKNLSVAEFALLSDITYDLKNNGEPKEQEKHLKLPQNIRFTFDIFGKYFKIKFDLHIGQVEWNHFLDAQMIRNRIAHPKMPQNFEITDSEIEICKDACSWFLNLLLELYEGLARKGGRASN